MLKHLNEVNDVEILDVSDPAFGSYGRIITGHDMEALVRYMEEHTSIPETGNVYLASVKELEELPVLLETPELLDVPEVP